MTDRADTVAQLKREFSAGLPDRLERLVTGLAALRNAANSKAIEAFYLEVHSLKGTAKAYGADHVARCAGDLSSLAGTWYDGGSTPVMEIGVAAERLEHLREAIEQYLEHTES